MEKLKGGKESKKTKKKRVEHGSGTEESSNHFGERDENECGKGSEICSQKNYVGSVIEKVEGKKKKGENSGVSDDKLHLSLDNVEGINRTTKCPDELQNGTDDLAVGQGSDRIVVMSGHKKTKRASKKSVGNLGFSAENMDVTMLTEQEIFENSNQQGESVEPFDEGNAFESVEKEEKRKKRKRKKHKSIEQEIFEKSDQQGESVEAFGEGHTLESVVKEEEEKEGCEYSF